MTTSDEPFFTPDFFRFFRELAKNNHREWFLANKARYERVVQRPSIRFVEAMGPGLAGLSKYVIADARPSGGSIFRIYRDIRFSKDKSPYKTAAGIHFSHEGSSKTEESLPGFFLHLGPGESAVYSGIWHPSPPMLKKIRDAIVADEKGWSRLLKQSPPVEGESYVRVPAGYDPTHPFAADLKRKDFAASLPFKDAEVTDARFGKSFLGACAKIDPLNAFLAKAADLPW